MGRTKLNFKSQVSKLYELREHIKATIENIERVMKEQNALIEIINASPRKNEINERFPSDLKDNLSELEKNLAMLAIQASCVDSLIEAVEKEKKENMKHSAYSTEQIITLFVTAYDMFKENRFYVEPVETTTPDAKVITEENKPEESVN